MDILLYHAHHDRYQEDISFWISTADQAGSLILELGCGTGRVLLPLARAGHQMFGLDHDLLVLKHLREHTPPELIEQVHLLQADLTAYHLEQQFHAILLPCNTLSTLGVEQARAAVQLVYQHLSPEGLFAASIPNPALFADLPEQDDPVIEDLFHHPLDAEPVQVTSHWTCTTDSFILTWNYDHLLPDGQVRRTSVSTHHHRIPAEWYLNTLRSAGFQMAECYGDFERAPYNPDSPFLIFTAEK